MHQFSAVFLLLFAWMLGADQTAAQSNSATWTNPTSTVSENDEKKAAIAVVLAHEQAVQLYDFDKLDSLHTTDYRGIEESYPHARRKPQYVEDFQPLKDAGIRIDYHPQDAVAEVRGDVAWVTVTLHSVWTADTPAGRVILNGNEWHATFVESWVLVKTPDGWKIALGHTSQLPPTLGFEVDYKQEHGGVKIAEVSKRGPADKAGFNSGDVLIAYGGQKIDIPDDLYRLRYAHNEGEKVAVTVIRGKDKITKEVILEAMK
jgi:ketosteroid isomerase-like protein